MFFFLGLGGAQGPRQPPLWLADDTRETDVGCGINQGQAPALLVAPCRVSRLLLSRLQAWPMRSELGAALARCSADISFSVLWLRCASAQSTRVRPGALAGENERMAMMSQLELVASEDASTLRQPCHCSTRHFSSLFESFELGIENPESPRGRLDSECVDDELRPEQQIPEPPKCIYVGVLF